MTQRRRSKLSRARQHRLIEHFVAGTPARTAAELVGVNRNTATLCYRKLRELLPQAARDHCRTHRWGEPLRGRGRDGRELLRRKGKPGRGAAGKTAVFGILKRSGRVYTVIPPDLKRATLMPVIRRQVRPDSVVYTDDFSACDPLGVAGFEHHRIDHDERLVSESGAHISGTDVSPISCTTWTANLR